MNFPRIFGETVRLTDKKTPLLKFWRQISLEERNYKNSKTETGRNLN